MTRRYSLKDAGAILNEIQGENDRTAIIVGAKLPRLLQMLKSIE
jgi:hypothetical protein